MAFLARISAAVALAALLLVPARASETAGVRVKGEKPLMLTGGAEVQLADYLVPGKTTVFDFFSEYCPPCRFLSPFMEKLHAARPDLAVVKVNINRAGTQGIDWGSPVARQYHLERVPFFRIYGPDGKLVSEGDAAYRTVVGWLQ
jgi:thiol-disulfide isomerase/thioredoxin